MKTEIDKVFQLNKFFTLHSQTNGTIPYNFTKSSLILLKNIYTSWLQSINSKRCKLEVFTTEKIAKEQKKTVPFGFFTNHVIKYDESTVLEHDIEKFTPKLMSNIQLNLMVPQHTSMQYFIQWQRYRKYWWSSVTTTPSLFAVNEIKYEEQTADANIVAQFPWGHKTVESVSMTRRLEENYYHLKCSMSLELAMYVLLLDGLMNGKESEYLKLHRHMAPYKISFALNVTDTTDKSKLNDLACLMHQKLKTNDISSCLPNFTLSLEQQIKENLQLGVSYTAVLSENTTINGILHLLNSSTMLKEEVHIADFDSYAALLCSK